MDTPRIWSAVNVSALHTEPWLQAIVTEYRSEALYILAESDVHYHRSVITFVGSFNTVKRAINALVEAASFHVDMNQHRGVHFRMGAVDVIPVVTLDAANLSHEIDAWGREISRWMPVVFYEKSAKKASHRQLKNIRKGGFEAVKETCLNGNAPFDYGTCEHAMTLGCVALGERDPLLAFNMAFQLEDPAPLKTIARTIRESGGGHLGLDAAVFRLRPSLYHLSMNLRRFDLYKVESIVRSVLDQMASHPDAFIGSEVIGLIAQSMSEQATKDIDAWIKGLKKTCRIQHLPKEKVLESVVDFS